MPHDRNGQPITAGDSVYVPCIVKRVELAEEFCNVTLETIEKMFPGDYTSSLVLNARQVVKQDV